MMDLKQREERNFQHVAGGATLEYASDTGDNNVFPSSTPQPAEMIVDGICTNCDNLGHCVWQHNNNTNCQHYQ